MTHGVAIHKEGLRGLTRPKAKRNPERTLQCCAQQPKGCPSQLVGHAGAGPHKQLPCVLAIGGAALVALDLAAALAQGDNLHSKGVRLVAAHREGLHPAAVAHVRACVCACACVCVCVVCVYCVCVCVCVCSQCVQRKPLPRMLGNARQAI